MAVFDGEVVVGDVITDDDGAVVMVVCFDTVALVWLFSGSM